MSQTGQSRLLSLAEAAALLRVDYETAREWVHAGKLKGRRLAGRRTIQVLDADIDAFIEESEVVPQTVPLSDRKPRKLTPKRRGQLAGESQKLSEIPWYLKVRRA